MASTLMRVKPLIGCLNKLGSRNLGLVGNSAFTCKKMSYPASSTPNLRLYSSDQQFAESQNAVKSLKQEPDNDIKLKLYALFKQGSVGKCNASKPGALDFVGKAKWTAWNKLGNMSGEDAKKEYVATVNQLINAEQTTAPSSNASSANSTQYPGLSVTQENGIVTILLNKPEKRNALTVEMYTGITNTLKDAAKDDNVKFVVMTGAGNYFCSGNDLGNFLKAAAGGEDLKIVSEKSAVLLEEYVGAYIDFPKPIVAVLNGPAVGIAVTILGLLDVVYAIDTATFHTPFSALGQSPEGCSSYIFPKLMGYTKANELLMLNKRITAQEAYACNLLTAVIPKENFEAEVKKRIEEMAKLPHLSLAYAKQLSRNVEKDILHKVNLAECTRLTERWTSEDCTKAIMNFFQSKTKI